MSCCDAKELVGHFVAHLSFAISDGYELNPGILLSSNSETCKELIDFFSADMLVNQESFSCPALHINRIGIKRCSNGSENFALADIAALVLSQQLEIQRSSLDSVPRQLICNIIYSFSQLLNTRLRNACTALIIQSMKVCDELEVHTLKRILFNRFPIDFNSAAISFNISDASETILQHIPNTFSFPLIMNISVGLRLLGKVQKVHLICHGTITSTLDSKSNRFRSVKIALDTVELLQKLVEEAKLIVKKTLRRAAHITALYMQLKRNQLNSDPEIPNTDSIKYDDILSNYPTHVQSTVKQFLPNQIINDYQLNVWDSYPAHIAETLKELIGGKGQ